MNHGKAPAPSRIVETASTWKLRTRTLQFGEVPLLMGIVNVTPDSFSDGGKFLDIDQAVAHALDLVHDGAAIIDIGGESTRPYSPPISQSEELRRVVPVIERLAAETDIPISVDTSKSAVARAALDAGAEIINDVSGFQGDPNMVAVARDFGAAVCVMHMQGTPQTMQDNPSYEDVVEEVAAYMAERTESLVAAGIDRQRICLDPGIGFGKTHQHNLTLIAQSLRFHRLGRPILIGHSRKGFIGKLMGTSDLADRDAGTLALSIFLAQQRIQILRVHNVAQTYKAFALLHAVSGALHPISRTITKSQSLDDAASGDVER